MKIKDEIVNYLLNNFLPNLLLSLTVFVVPATGAGLWLSFPNGLNFI